MSICSMMQHHSWWKDEGRMSRQMRTYTHFIYIQHWAKVLISIPSIDTTPPHVWWHMSGICQQRRRVPNRSASSASRHLNATSFFSISSSIEQLCWLHRRLRRRRLRRRRRRRRRRLHQPQHTAFKWRHYQLISPSLIKEKPRSCWLSNLNLNQPNQV